MATKPSMSESEKHQLIGKATMELSAARKRAKALEAALRDLAKRVSEFEAASEEVVRLQDLLDSMV